MSPPSWSQRQACSSLSENQTAFTDRDSSGCLCTAGRAGPCQAQSNSSGVFDDSHTHQKGERRHWTSVAEENTPQAVSLPFVPFWRNIEKCVLRTMCAQACGSTCTKVGITNRLVQPWLTAWLWVLDTMFFWVNTYALLYLAWMCSHLVLALTASQFIMRSACLHILRHKNWRQVDLHLFIFSGVFLWLHSPLLCLHCAQRVCLETGVFSSKETDEQPLPDICSLYRGEHFRSD